MKKILFSILIFGVFLFYSCNHDFLDTKPSTEFSELAVWNDPALVESFINQIYFRLDEPLTVGKMKANYVDEGHYRGNSDARNFNRSNITADNIPGWWTFRYRSWADLYKSIRYCNIFFDNVDRVPFLETKIDGKTMKDRMTGEVHFLRAMLYHFLVNDYGGVPLISNVYSLEDEFAVPRNTYEDCINFIVKECDEAASLLPEKNSGDNNGRATKGAALALKSRVLLYAASDLHNTYKSTGYSNPELIGYTSGSQSERWLQAKEAAKAVIDMNRYTLYKAEPTSGESVADNIANIFISRETEEDIFIKFFTTNMNQRFGIYSTPNGYHGWGVNAPLGNLVDDYRMADGAKFDWNNSKHAAEPYKNREPRFYATIFYDGAPWRVRPDDVKGIDPHNKIQTGVRQVWNQSENKMVEVYGVDTRKSPIEDWNGSYTGYYCRKYLDPNNDAQYVSQSMTWRFIRYAEVLMNYAEACIELGEDVEARKYINMVRKRAGLPDITESGDELRQVYRNERRIEFAFEEQRFYDVRRWVIGPDVYTGVLAAKVVYELKDDKTTATIPTVSHFLYESYSWNDKAYFLPILRDELNKNDALVQNPGY